MKRLTFILFLISVSGIVHPVTVHAGDDFPEIHGWRFDNETYYKKLKGSKLITYLPWEIFIRSYIGICPDKSTAKYVCPLDYAFWEAYNAAFEVCEGNCFGMCLLASLIYKEEGHLGFCKPAYTYSGDTSGPSSARLCTTITVMQCHEWSQSGILWMADVINGANASDPNYAYEQVEYYQAMGDPPLLTMVKDRNFEGHTLLPYRTEESGGKRYIYIYDPNRYYPNDSLWYDSLKNYVEIDKSSNSWKFDKGGGETWGTDPDAAIFVTPTSTVKAASRNPLSLSGIQDALNSVFLTGAAISQISDGEGHRYYKNNIGEHTGLGEIEKDENLRMKNVIRMPLTFGKAKGTAPEIYFMKGVSGKDLKFEIAGKGDEYNFKFAGKDNLIEVKSMEKITGRDEFEFQKIGDKEQELKVSSERGSANFSIELYKQVPNTDISRRFKISNVKVRRDSPVFLKVTDEIDGVMLKSEKEPVICDLEITQVVGEEITKLDKKRIDLSGEDWQKVAPSDWNRLKDSEVRVKRVLIKKLPEKKK